MDTFIILTAYNEADHIEATLRALASGFPDAPIWVADDGSNDGTSRIARRLGARVVRSERSIGKGGAATLAAREALACLHGSSARSVSSDAPARPHANSTTSPPTSFAPDASSLSGPSKGTRRSVAVLCDADLGESASLLVALVEEVRESRADLAVATFAKRIGGGLGVAVGFAGWAIRRRCGLKLEAPISGQRALSVSALRDVLPFAEGFGMELGMTIDATRAGYRVTEVELDLRHRATGRTFEGFAHRGRQLLDCARAYRARG